MALADVHSKAAVPLLFICCLLLWFCVCSMFYCLETVYCYVALLRSAVGWSAVCDCGTS